MKRAIVTCAVLVLAGCAQRHWTKPGADSAQFEKDKAECLYEGNKATASDPNMFAGLMANNLATQCMQLRGYSLISDKEEWRQIKAQEAANEKLHPLADQKAQQLIDLQKKP